MGTEIHIGESKRILEMDGGGGLHKNEGTWRIPGTEEPGGLQSMGSHRVDTTEAT